LVFDPGLAGAGDANEMRIVSESRIDLLDAIGAVSLHFDEEHFAVILLEPGCMLLDRAHLHSPLLEIVAG